MLSRSTARKPPPIRPHRRTTGPDIGRAEKLEDARGRYVVFLKQTFPRDLSLDGVRVVVDAESKRILGASLLGTEGDEAVHCFLDAMAASDGEGFIGFWEAAVRAELLADPHLLAE